MGRRRARPRPAVFGLGLALTLAVARGGLAARAQGPSGPDPATPAAAARPRTSPTLYHKNKSFRIPFNIDPADQPSLKEVQLWVSDDSGFSWKTASRTTPDRPYFTFRAPRDAEFWFAVRTLSKQGVLYPAEDQKVEPSMKVVVDTTPPTLVLEPDGRRGALAAVRWEVKDDYLDMKTLRVEYQEAGARDWRAVPIRRRAYLGSETWDAGTAETLKVRGSIADKAGNVAETVIELSDGTPANPGLTSGENTEFTSPPPIAQISSPGSELPSPEEAPVPAPQGAAARPPVASAPPPAESLELPEAPTVAPQRHQPPPQAPPLSPVGSEPDPFAGTAPEGSGGAPAVAQAVEGGAGQTLLVANPVCAIQYAVDDAGPGGPAVVELWVTPDGGRTWIRKGEDPDRTSPFQVDLGGDGTFGLRVVARGASGLGDQPPAPNDPPHLWVEVDRTPPAVQLLAPAVGTGANIGKVAIRWRASDLHLAPKPVTISWRPDQPGAAWQAITEQPIDNSGKFVWAVPTTVPPKFYLRVTAVDSVGNPGVAETPEGAPVIVDRTRPRSRILGLDQAARPASGPRQ